MYEHPTKTLNIATTVIHRNVRLRRERTSEESVRKEDGESTMEKDTKPSVGIFDFFLSQSTITP